MYSFLDRIVVLYCISDKCKTGDFQNGELGETESDIAGSIDFSKKHNRGMTQLKFTS